MTDKITKYHNQFRSGSLSRREFVKLLAAMGVSATVMGDLLATPVQASSLASTSGDNSNDAARTNNAIAVVR